MATELALNRSFSTLSNWTYNAPKSSGSFAFPTDVDRQSSILWLYNPHVWADSMHLDAGLVGHAANACAYCADGLKFRDPCGKACDTNTDGYFSPEPASTRNVGLTYIHSGSGITLTRGKLYHLTMEVERRSRIHPTTPPPWNWKYVAQHGPACQHDDPDCTCYFDADGSCAGQLAAAHDLTTNEYLYTSLRNGCSIMIYSPRLAQIAKLRGNLYWDGSTGGGYEPGQDQTGWYGQAHWTYPVFMGSWTGSDWNDVGFTHTFSFDFRIPEFWWSLLDGTTFLPILNGVSNINFYISVVWGPGFTTDDGATLGITASQGPPYGVDFRVKPNWSLQLIGNVPITPPNCGTDYHLSPDGTYCIENPPPPPPPPPCPIGQYRDADGNCVDWPYSGGTGGGTTYPQPGGTVEDTPPLGNLEEGVTVAYDCAGGGSDLAMYWVSSNPSVSPGEALGSAVQVWKYGFQTPIPFTAWLPDSAEEGSILVSHDVDPRNGKRYLALETFKTTTTAAYVEANLLSPGVIQDFIYLIAVDPDTPSTWSSFGPTSFVTSVAGGAGVYAIDIFSDTHNVWVVFGSSGESFIRNIASLSDVCTPATWMTWGDPFAGSDTFIPAEPEFQLHSMVYYEDGFWIVAEEASYALASHYDILMKAKICRGCFPCASTGLHVWQRF